MDSNITQNQLLNQQPLKLPGVESGIASVVLGIIALLCIFFGVFSWIGIISGIAGLILGIISKKQVSSGRAIAGIVMSAIGLGLCAFVFFVSAIFYGIIVAMLAGIFNYIDFNSINFNF